MKIILLSGGSGTRLWPLSNGMRSKQFLKLLRGSDGGYQSMVQRVYEQIQAAGLDAEVFVATNSAQADSIKAQLGDRAEIILEPSRRNTFPAVALSCAFLRYEKNVSPEEAVIVLPVDPFAEIGYFHALREMEKAVASREANLALLGVVPSYPAEKYGYIVPSPTPSHSGRIQVSSFREKPEREAARELIRQGALWNCGVFAFRLGYMIDILNRHLPYSAYPDIRDRYDQLEKNSFDYAVTEKEASIVAVAYEGVWKDLGTWNTLTEEIEEPSIGNVLFDAHTCENTHIINELDIPLIAMGARNMVIVAANDGILVAEKSESSYQKALVDQVEQRPMYAERHWGKYKVIDQSACENGMQTLTKKVSLKAGGEIHYRLREGLSCEIVILSGEGDILAGGDAKPLRTGDVAHFGHGAAYTLRAETEMTLIEITIGAFTAKDDI